MTIKKQRPAGKTAKSIFLLIVLGLLLFYMYRHRADFAIVHALDISFLLPVFLCIAVGQVVVSYIFHLLLTFIAHSFSFLTTLKYIVLGRFLNKFVPFAGGVYRIMMFKKSANVSYEKSISMLVSFSWLNTFMSLLVGSIIISITNPALHFKQVPILLFFLILIFLQLLLIPILSFILKKFPAVSVPHDQEIAPTFPLAHFFKIAATMMQQILSVLKNQRLLVKTFILFGLDVSLNMAVLYFLFRSLAVVATLPFLILLVVTMRLSTVIEITPGNLGVREFVYGFLAGGMGQTMAQGIVVSLLFRLIGGVTQGLISLVLIVFTNKEVATLSEQSSVFLLAPSLPFRGGIAHYNTLLYNHLRQRGEVMFYTYKKQYFQWLFPGATDKDHSQEKIELQDEGPFNWNQQKNGIRRTLHPLNLFSWYKAGRTARHYSLVVMPWWVVFWAPYYFLFLVIVRFNNPFTKVLFICHNVTEHERRWTGALKKWLAYFILKRGDYFIVHSQSQYEQLQLLFKNKKKPALVCPHPQYHVFNKDRYTLESARQVLAIPNQRKVFIFFGFIRKYKGLEYLLRALPLVKAYFPDVLLIIAGEVWGGARHYGYYQELVQDLQIEQNICFLNRYIVNEEVELYFKAADFVVLPYIDGTGSGILQVAYGMDKPVVATRVGAFADVVVEGKTGLLVPPADENELAQAIIKMYTVQCIQEMSDYIRFYKKRFAWSHMVDCILEGFPH